jgi:hypothetical protein
MVMQLCVQLIYAMFLVLYPPPNPGAAGDSAPDGQKTSAIAGSGPDQAV